MFRFFGFLVLLGLAAAELDLGCMDNGLGPCDPPTITCPNANGINSTCIKSRGICCDDNQLYINGQGGAPTTTTTTTIAPAADCYDKVGPNGYSDCPSRAGLCDNAIYYDLMTQQCPKTCNRCNGANNGSGSGTACADKGTDCPSRAYLCTDSIYYDLMTQQCPRTCGRC